MHPPDQAEKRFLFGMVPPRSSVTADYAETCYRRGEFHFGPVLLETSAPFGLFRARRQIEARSSVLVYPEVFPATGINIFSNPVEGQSLTSPARHFGEFRGSREYQTGDSLRSIHWRSSARQRRLMVKQYDKSPENQVTLAFDATKTFDEGKETTLEYSIKLAASVARDCFLQGTPFMMIPPGPSLETSDWRAVLDYLARLELGQGPTLEDSLATSMSHGPLLTIVALADHRAIETIARVPASRLAAVVVLQGFAPAGEKMSDLEGLRNSGVPVVTCEIGDVPSALTDLARLAPSRSVTHHERVGATHRRHGQVPATQ